MTEITQEEYEKAYKVIEKIREQHRKTGLVSEADTLNEAHSLIQIHEQEGEFEQVR